VYRVISHRAEIKIKCFQKTLQTKGVMALCYISIIENEVTGDMQMRGRRHKFSNGQRFRVKGDLPAPADFRERVGVVVAQGPAKAEYTVRFDDDPTNVTYLQSNWMELIEQPQPVTAA
jgi:hypothetical protein